MNLGDIMNIAASGLEAQRARLAIAASNIANAETTRTREGGPYRRRDPVFRAESVAKPFADHLTRQLRGVSIDGVVEDSRDFVTRFQPGHPDADAEGLVRYPAVNIVEEQTNILSATRSFEANLLLIRKVRAMAEAALRIGG